jgi:hypothetical protein
MRKAVIWWLAYNTDDIKTRFPLPIKLLYIKISGMSQKLALQMFRGNHKNLRDAT